MSVSASPSERLDGLRIVFFGMGGVFSRLPLEALLHAGADLRAVVTPEPHDLSRTSRDDAPFTIVPPPIRSAIRRTLPLAGGAPPPLSLRELAAASAAPLVSVARLNDPATLAALAEFRPDAICVACFTQRLSSALLRLPRLGCLNAHPSLLPANRGPDPLFWVFHSGASEIGVTVHLMDEGLDTGPIITQARAPLEPGETEAALELRLATLAGRQMVEALAGLRDGALGAQPQPSAHASAQSWPAAEDYAIPAAQWLARRAYTFACGVVGRGQPITLIASDGARFRLVEPLNYDAEHTLEIPWRLDGDRLTLACAQGIFTCRVASGSGR